MTAVNSLARPELLAAGFEVEVFKSVEVRVKFLISFSPGLQSEYRTRITWGARWC